MCRTGKLPIDRQGCAASSPLCAINDVVSAMQLARNGANVHHVTGRPDGTTALHECVARGHERVADLLLHYGASPFLENARGAPRSAQYCCPLVYCSILGHSAKN